MKNAIGNDQFGGLVKIDNLASNGLLGVEDSLSYRIAEIEGHHHNYESWFGGAAVPNGTIHVADRFGPSIAAFRLTSGNNAWGNWVQILGSGDTPQRIGTIKFDLHRVLIINADAVGTYFIQIGFGVTGAGALTAGTYTEFPHVAATVQADVSIVSIMSPRQTKNTLVWARTLIPGQSAKLVDFYYGLHEYLG